jgi:hypothetical protein
MTDFPGYRPPTPPMIEAVTMIKQEEERVLRFIEGLDIDLDPRWRAIALTHYQEGTMSLIRAILRPGRIGLPEDQPQPQPAPIPAEDFTEATPASTEQMN